MKLISSEKYSVAWFKLAEFVGRGEKERALGIYKLLAHTVDDRAFALQLKGDLLLAFADAQAIEIYHEAVKLYSNEQRYIQASALYEHLLLLCPDRIDFRIQLVSIYKHLASDKKILKHLTELSFILSTNYKFEEANNLLREYQLEDEQIAYVHQQCAINLLKNKNSNDSAAGIH